MPDTLGITPRPAFWEEFDLLKFDEFGWTYPHCEEPLLWACNKQYFYRGRLMIEAKGANVYDAAIVVFRDDADRRLTLNPVDVEEMLKQLAKNYSEYVSYSDVAGICRLQFTKDITPTQMLDQYFGNENN